MFLTGPEILRRIEANEIEIKPFDPALINPNSLDLTLSEMFKVYTRADLDARADNPTETFSIPNGGLMFEPGTLYIGSTCQWTQTGNLLPLLDGKSSLGRLGVSVHQCAGIGDVGFVGTWTLEITVVHPVRLYAGMRIAQLRLAEVTGEITEYVGRYQRQYGPTPSRMHEGQQ